jgi:hypothetical protein
MRGCVCAVFVLWFLVWCVYHSLFVKEPPPTPEGPPPSNGVLGDMFNVVVDGMQNWELVDDARGDLKPVKVLYHRTPRPVMEPGGVWEGEETWYEVVVVNKSRRIYKNLTVEVMTCDKTGALEDLEQKDYDGLVRPGAKVGFDISTDHCCKPASVVECSNITALRFAPKP